MNCRGSLSRAPGVGCVLVTLATLLGACGGSKKWPPNGPPANTYTCACTCDTHATLYPYSPSSTPITHSDWVTVCAADAAAAEWKCPQACSHYLSKQIADYHANEVIDKCEVEPGDPAQLARDGVCDWTKTYALMAARPNNASLEGPVDFGVSSLDITIPADSDSLHTTLKGTIVMVGGNCAGQECPIEIWYAALTPKGPVTTAKGRAVKNLTALNSGVWRGTKHADNSFVLDASSQLSLSATIDDKPGVLTLNPNAYFQGKIDYSRTRLTGSGAVTNSNALVVEGDFLHNDARIKLHIVAWLTNCQPYATAKATCWPGVDGGDKWLWLSWDSGLLGNLKGQDLCNAVVSGDPAKVCQAGMQDEFPTFSCNTTALPAPTDKPAVADRLSFKWEDGTGAEIPLGVGIGANGWTVLDYMPAFPLTFSVENEWGQSVSQIIESAPTGPACPPPRLKMVRMPPRTFVAQALALLYAGKDEAAQRALEDLVVREPSYAYGHYHLGLICLHRGERRCASTHLRRFLELAPQAPEAPSVKERLGAASDRDATR